MDHRGVKAELGEVEMKTDLAGGGRSTMGCPWQMKAGDAVLVRARQSLTSLGVGTTCLAATRGSRDGSFGVLRRSGAMATPDIVRR
jgi:hypothetical protein